jgi:hypothetical protein
MGWKCTVCREVTLTFDGRREALTAGLRVTVAMAFFVGSARLVAVMVTSVGLRIHAGAL